MHTTIKHLSFFICFSLFLLACKSDTPVEQKITFETTPIENTSNAFQLMEGDLLFQDGDCGSFCEAIEKVTHGYNGARLSHVGIVIQGGNSEFSILEAISKGVVETSVDSFLNRSSDKAGNPKVLVGRLKPDQRELIQPAIQSALQHRGKAYDEVFNLENDKFYCSELIYFGFKDANNGTPIFQLRPMTYKDPETKETFPAWLEYFQQLGKFIPEGKPGLNPGSMSRSIYLDIIHAYGEPEGFRGLRNKSK